MLRFSITPEVQTMRYAGLDVPADDIADARLKEPHVLAVVTYAGEEGILRELLLTHTSPQGARELRSYADITHTLALIEKPSRRLRIGFKANQRGAATVEVTEPFKVDDLDGGRAVAARIQSGGVEEVISARDTGSGNRQGSRQCRRTVRLARRK